VRARAHASSRLCCRDSARLEFHVGNSIPTELLTKPPRLLPNRGVTHGPFVYQLGHGPLKAERRVRFPYGLPITVLHCSMELPTNRSKASGRYFFACFGRSCLPWESGGGGS
jgi:hypothetical protein